MSQKLDYPALLPPNWKAVYLPLWFAEDFSGLDITSALVGNGPGAASLFLKSRTVRSFVLFIVIVILWL